MYKRYSGIEVVICESCKGWGYHQQEVCTDYHRGEYELGEKTTCHTCGGTGRMTKTVETTFKTL